jgi:hypothetical protein
VDTQRLYYDFEKVRKIDPLSRPPQFVFNTGQWFGTAGVLARADFEPWMQWAMPRVISPPGYFMNGEQGILNYVINQKALVNGLCVERRKIMRWPAHSMDGLDVATVASRVAEPMVVHWAGLKKARQRDMIAGDLLAYFEELYYRQVPGGAARRLFAGFRDASSHWLREVHVKATLAAQKLFAQSRAAAST